MNTLLLFFALPIATILLSIVLQKILKCPALVAITFFAIYLIVAFAVFNSSFLIFAIIYTILAYITAVITRLICNIRERIRNCNPNFCNSANIANAVSNLNNTNINRNIDTCNNTNENNNESNNQARFTVTTNQANPVFFLTSRNNVRRNNCCCNRRWNKKEKCYRNITIILSFCYKKLNVIVFFCELL